MKRNEQWSNEVIESIQGMKRATPSGDLFNKINSKIQKYEQLKLIPLNKLAFAAVAACIMITINIFAYTDNAKIGKNNIVANEQIFTDFMLYN